MTFWHTECHVTVVTPPSANSKKSDYIYSGVVNHSPMCINPFTPSGARWDLSKF